MAALCEIRQNGDKDIREMSAVPIGWFGSRYGYRSKWRTKDYNTPFSSNFFLFFFYIYFFGRQQKMDGIIVFISQAEE